MIISGNTFYGTAGGGGSSGYGTVFKVNTDGTAFTNLYNFNGGSDGDGPSGSLILSSNALYGVAGGGGSSGYGTVFALSLVPSAPIITVQPQSRTAQAGSTVSFTVAASDYPPPNYQWRKNGVNILNATNATLTLNSVGASASAGYSVVVWNAYGSVVSATASLAVLTDGANGNQPTQLDSSTPPPSEPAQDSLVVVTHGWQNSWLQSAPPSDVPWVTDLAAKISQRLDSEGKNNWQVVPCLWTKDAWTLLPETAAINGAIVGHRYGMKLGARLPHWQHIHLIGHSAGAAFIESAAAAIKLSSSTIEVHTTFLDPMVGVTTVGKLAYGNSADWSDNYFAQDGTLYTTESLPHAYNVDVSWLDPDKQVTPAYDSDFVTANFGSCVPLSSHEWPHDFYSNSVVNASPPCAAPYGFALSKEAGGWNNHVNYHPGDSAPPPCRDCPQLPMPQDMPFYLNGLVDLDKAEFSTSPSGAAYIDASAFQLYTTETAPAPIRPLGNGPQDSPITPAWLAVGMSVTNSANFVQFDSAFTGTNGAEGLMTVYWNTNQIGMVDQRVEPAGLQTYRFSLPGAVTNGLYTLSFRLDSFNGTLSSVTVTNVTTGFAGLDKPFRLDMLLMGSNNAPVLKLTAPVNYSYLVESSTNLLDWNPAALLLNANGTVLFADPAATNSSSRFYRAVAYSPFIPDLPTLTATRVGNDLLLLWPTNYADFTLEYTTYLPPTSWTSNSVSPAIVNGQYTVTNPISNGARFYRLKK